METKLPKKIHDFYILLKIDMRLLILFHISLHSFFSDRIFVSAKQIALRKSGYSPLVTFDKTWERQDKDINKNILL